MVQITCLSHLDILNELKAPLSAGEAECSPLQRLPIMDYGGQVLGRGTESLLASEIPCRALTSQNTQKLKMRTGNLRLPERLRG